ncbi:MAG: hypothetical protein CMO98_05570 [Woeseia sp.]|nr:hypothetical protein [Woeseia sp.]|tara:strand:- start:253 stop:669 length:417 start_codon:yes stop_codon:yes gene_type:complete
MSYWFEGEEYRDDRMYVINLNRGTISKDGKKEKRYLLTTYRNTTSLPATRSDDFASKEEAINYLKQVEPGVPLVSNQGKCLEIPEGVDRWKYWNNWLKEKGLQSATTEYQNLPDWVRKEGHNPENNYVTVEEIDAPDK